MTIELKVPSLGESITEVVIGQWLVQPGDWVALDAPVVEIETDKVNTELPAPVAGRVARLLFAPGATVRVGEAIAAFEAGEAPLGQRSDQAPPAAANATANVSNALDTTRVMPAARRALAAAGLEPTQVVARGPGGRLSKEDVAQHIASTPPPAFEPQVTKHATVQSEPASTGEPQQARGQQRVALTPLRKRIAERLLAAQQQAALLTTFNEVDMSAVLTLRKRYQQAFQERYQIKLGLMSFFVKAAIEALKACPELNAALDGETIVYHDYYDIGIAVGSGRGLVVPVIRDAERHSFAELEQTIADFSQRARDRKLTLAELQGGTFTISNGGVYGSMLSTPILNPPQTGILGMHNIVERPVAIEGAVVVRPVMYVALTYDHRLIDGREAVTFLVRIKQAIEDPTRMLIEV